MTMIREFAPAKLNLYLHVTGRKPDGYHELDSFVAFASVGDEIALRPAKSFAFEIAGEQAAALEHEKPEDNLVVKAARSLAELTGHALDVHLVLVKNLPVASGIGGGSSDAAATLRVLARHWGLSKDDPRLTQAASRHGQDVPVCLRVENTYMTATGVISAPKLPRAHVVLINPGKGLSTPAVFKSFCENNDAFSPLARLTKTPEAVADLVEELKARHNDLYAPACRIMPEVADILAVLEASDECLLARMSGSGATCFGLYKDAASAKSVAAQIHAYRPHWWIRTGVLND